MWSPGWQRANGETDLDKGRFYFLVFEKEQEKAEFHDCKKMKRSHISMRSEQDYYKVLGIAPNASVAEINDAYHKLAFIYHPDRNLANPEANGKMIEINVAYTALSKQFQRSDYNNPVSHYTSEPKFKTGSKVKVNSRSSPYADRIGVVDKEPVKDSFHVWYTVKLESYNLVTLSRFAEEQLKEITG
jgi:curved DNA-binding protein CbpA